MGKTLGLMLLLGAFWAFQHGFAREIPVQVQSEVGIRIPVILRFKVAELGLRVEALPQGEITLEPGTYRIRILANTRWQLWVIPPAPEKLPESQGTPRVLSLLAGNLSAEGFRHTSGPAPRALVLQGKGRGEASLEIPPGGPWQVRPAPGWR